MCVRENVLHVFASPVEDMLPNLCVSLRLLESSPKAFAIVLATIDSPYLYPVTMTLCRPSDIRSLLTDLPWFSCCMRILWYA